MKEDGLNDSAGSGEDGDAIAMEVGRLREGFGGGVGLEGDAGESIGASGGREDKSATGWLMVGDVMAFGDDIIGFFGGGGGGGRGGVGFGVSLNGTGAGEEDTRPSSQ